MSGRPSAPTLFVVTGGTSDRVVRIHLIGHTGPSQSTTPPPMRHLRQTAVNFSSLMQQPPHPPWGSTHGSVETAVD